MNKTLLALYGLKWNPFAPAVPASALHVGSRIDSFRRRVTYLAAEGGFALVTGEPGTGKSATLRILADPLAGPRQLGSFAHPRRSSGRPARRQGLHDQPATGQYRRLLPRDGRPLRRRTAAAQPMGRNPDPPSALAGTYRRRALQASPHRRRSPGNPALGSLRATSAVVDKTGFPHPADHRAGGRRPSRRASALR